MSESDLSMDLDGKTYHAVTQDYSVDGLSANMEGELPVKAGDLLELSVPMLGIRTTARVVRALKRGNGMSIAFQRVGQLYGALANFSVADILLGLQRSTKTGQLYLKSGSVQKTVIFLRGDIIFASSSMRQDWLGEMLLREKKITRQQFDESSQVMKSSGKRHGTVLVEMGLLKPKDLFDAVTRTVELIILSLFKMRKGEFLFKEGPLPEDETIKLKLSAANLIYRGVRGLEDIEAVRALSPKGDQVICFSTDPLDLFQDLRLSPEDKKLFLMVDGRKTYRELVQGSGIDSFEAMRAFNALLSTRVIDVQEGVFARGPIYDDVQKQLAADAKPRQEDEPPEEAQESPSAADIFEEPAAGPKGPSQADFIRSIEQMYREHSTLGYYGVLELPEDASTSMIKKAYYSQARTYHPDKHYGLPEEMKDKLNAIFTYITQAYSVLSNPRKRSEYDKGGGKGTEGEPVTDPLKRATVKFEEAMVLFNNRNYEQAAHAFGEAAYLDSENAKYHYYGAMALNRGGRHKEAERTLQRAMRIDPSNADYLAEAGHIYLALGFAKRAQTSFDKAVKLAPMHKRAMEGISKLPPGT